MTNFIKYTDILIHKVVSQYFNQKYLLPKLVCYRILKNFQQKEETEICIHFAKNSCANLGTWLCPSKRIWD